MAKTTPTKTEKALIQLDKINAHQLIEISKWEKSQKQIVKDNPFVEITNTETYNQAKSNRTALLKGRTSLLGANGQEAVIKSTFKNLLTGSVAILKELANVTEPHYTKQQDEVKRYEAVIEERRLERVRIAEEERLAEEKRILDINNKIDAVYEDFRTVINQISFNEINGTQEGLTALKEVDTSVYEEFEVTYYKTLERLEELLNERIESLTVTENQRLENIKLAEERKVFEQEKAKAKEESDKKQAIIEAKNKEIEEENQKKLDEIAKKEADIKAEQDRLQKIEDDKVEELRIAKEEKLRIANEKKEAKRLKALQPDKIKAIEQIESLQITIENTVKDKEVKELLSQFEIGVDILRNEYIQLTNNLK